MIEDSLERRAGRVPSQLARAAGDMAARVREFDWSRTSLGPMEQWPEALKLALGICLNSRFPMFVWWGPDYINIYNDAYVPMLGERHPRALGRPARDSWDDIWDIVGAQADAVTQRGEATWNERVKLVMHRHGYQEDTWFTWSYSPIYDEAGKIAGMFCAVTEETGRIIAERERDALLERAESERVRLADAFAHSPSFLAVLRGPEHVFEFANERYFQLIGHRDIIGKPVRLAIPEVVDQGYLAVLDRVYSSGEPYVGSGLRISLQRAPEAPADEVFLDFVYQPMRGPDGSVGGILVHGIDVTERQKEADELARVERVLRESEARFRQLADAMPQIVFTATADGEVDYFNRRWYEYTGLVEGETTAESWKKVHTEDGLRRVMEAWPRALRTGETYEIEYPLRRHDGEYRWHLGRALPIRDASGTIVRWFGTNTDIHDGRQLQDALKHSLEAEQHARSEAELASRMKDEFLATLSHELRTPLNAILGWSHMLRQDVTAKQLAHGADVIERNARAQSRIIEDLLDMSAIISGKIRLDSESIDPADVVRAAVETARPAAEAKQVRVSIDGGGVRGARITGDPNRLQQVLWNLLSNAVKFTPRGGHIEVRMARPDDANVEITVVDSGEGISAEFLPYVFDRFRQADASTTRRHGGLGLGLAIVKQLVELHGGSVRVASEGPGRGAAFTVTLPLVARANHEAAAKGGTTSARSDASEAARTSLAGLRVLVVDDDADARDLVKRLLEEHGAAAIAAASSAEAMELVAHMPFDVLVSDIGMPTEDGHAFIRRLRALPPDRGGAIPAIALTAYARPEDRIQAIRAGFHVHAAKPVEPAELIALVKSLALPR